MITLKFKDIDCGLSLLILATQQYDALRKHIKICSPSSWAGSEKSRLQCKKECEAAIRHWKHIVNKLTKEIEKAKSNGQS